MKLNLNDIVKVTLTEKGLKHFVKYHEDAFKEYPLSYRPRIIPPKDGRYQLHDLMSIFGSQMIVGCSPVFENNEIEICV